MDTSSSGDDVLGRDEGDADDNTRELQRLRLDDEARFDEARADMDRVIRKMQSENKLRRLALENPDVIGALRNGLLGNMVTPLQALRLSVTHAEVALLLERDNLVWIEWFKRYFSDVIRDVGDTLPSWIILQDKSNMDERYARVPWRRYFWWTVFFARRCYKELYASVEDAWALYDADPSIRNTFPALNMHVTNHDNLLAFETILTHANAYNPRAFKVTLSYAAGGRPKVMHVWDAAGFHAMSPQRGWYDQRSKPTHHGNAYWMFYHLRWSAAPDDIAHLNADAALAYQTKVVSLLHAPGASKGVSLYGPAFYSEQFKDDIDEERIERGNDGAFGPQSAMTFDYGSAMVAYVAWYMSVYAARHHGKTSDELAIVTRTLQFLCTGQEVIKKEDVRVHWPVLESLPAVPAVSDPDTPHLKPTLFLGQKMREK